MRKSSLRCVVTFHTTAGAMAAERLCRREGLEGRLVLQVHDELIVECPESEAERVSALLKEAMEGVMALSVPLLAETGAGTSWAQAH